MPRWKLRDPSIFPVAYTDTVLLAFKSNSSAYLSSHFSVYSAHQSMDRFREWRFCLRNGSHVHRAFEIERTCKITISRRFVMGRYELWVSVREKLIHGLADLNPHLSTALGSIVP